MISISNVLKNALSKPQSQSNILPVEKKAARKVKLCPSQAVTDPHVLKIKKAPNRRCEAKFTAEQLVTKCHTLRYGKRRLLDLLLEWNEKYKGSVFFCYAKIADKCGFTPRHAKRLMKELEQEGFVTRQARSYQTNIYHMNKLFNSQMVRAKLGFILPAIFKMSLSVLTVLNVSGLQVQNTNVTPSLYNESYKRTIDSLSISKVGNTTVVVRPSVVFSQKQRRKVMQDKQREAAKKIRSLKLTQVGLVFVSCFPVAAQTFADDALRNSTVTIKNPEGFFYAMLFAYCKANKLRPDWTDMFLLKQLYGPNPFALPRVVAGSLNTKAMEPKKATPQVPEKPRIVRPSQGPLAIYQHDSTRKIPNKGSELTKAAAQASPEQLVNMSRWIPSLRPTSANTVLAQEIKKDYDDTKRLPVVTAAQIGLHPDELDLLADKEGF